MNAKKMLLGGIRAGWSAGVFDCHPITIPYHPFTPPK